MKRTAITKQPSLNQSTDVRISGRGHAMPNSKKPGANTGLEQIVRLLSQRYGDPSSDGFMARMRQDGLGDLVDLAEKMTHELIEKDPELALHVASQSPLWHEDDGVDGGIMPAMPEADTQPVDLEDDIPFDQAACLASCDGQCCRKRNYLQVSIADILQIVSSPAAALLGVRSTADLFGRNPPLVVCLFNEEYGLQLPYIRFKAEGSDPYLAPEDASDCVCPFLFPIEEVNRIHRIATQEGCARNAHGCVLLRHRPKVCRLSPLGAFAGLETGRLSYVYAPPTPDCPACKTNVTVKTADFLREALRPGESEQDRRMHEIMMATTRTHLSGAERRRYGEVLRQLYNIDDLLIRNGRNLGHRPGVEQLVSIAVHAARGDFAPYDALLEGD
jgi:hypothetical protein